MSSPIQYRLGLVLKVSSKFITDAINKSPIVSLVLSEEILELSQCHLDSLGVTFILVLTLYYWLAEEQSGKWDAVGSAGPTGLEVVFTLLTKAIVVYVQVPIIEFGKPSFERLFARARPVILFQQLDGSCLSLQELLAQLLDRTWNWERSRSQSKNLSPGNRRERNGSIAVFGGDSCWISCRLILTA